MPWAAFVKRWRWLGVLPVIFAALVPFFDPRLPFSTDGKIHLFRLVEMDSLLRQGVLWPRFAPDMALGYGYPLFNYYAPLTYYLGVGLHWLGLDFVPALLTLLAGSIVLGALGVYKLTDELFGPVAGYVGAAAFAFAPYVFVNTLARCTAAEALGLALLPWLMWSLRRALTAPGALASLRLSLMYAALLLTHNLSAVSNTGLLLVLAGVELLRLVRQEGRWALWRRGAPAAAALGLGLLIAAGFWMPAVLETHYVQLSRLTSPAVFDYRRYFLTLLQLVLPPVAFDQRLVPPPTPMAFGLPLAGLALVGGLAWRRQRQSANRWWLLTLSALLAGLLAMTLPLSAPLWEHVSLLPLFQFPWRFIGPATVLAALLAGAVFGELHLSPLKQRWLAAATVIVIALYGFAWTYAQHYPSINQPGLTDLHNYEASSGILGTTATGEYLPAGVTQLPPQQQVAAQYAAGGKVERLDRESLPKHVTVNASSSGELSAQAALSAPQPFVATFLWFYFPGWQAEVDGQPAQAQASVPYGLLEVAVPAGEHNVRVHFGTTPLRQAAESLSWLGLIGLAVWVAAQRWLGRKQPRPASAVVNMPAGQTLIWLAAIGLGLGALRAYWAVQDNPFQHSRYDGQRVAGVGRDLDFNFGDELNLIGIDSPAAVAADAPLPITLYWRPYGQPATDYSIGLQLVDAKGHSFGQQDSWHPNGFPTSAWLPDDYGQDEHVVQAYPGTPPGLYRVMVNVYPRVGGGPALNVYDANYQPLGNSVEAATIKLTEPSRPPSDAELAPQHLLHQSLGPLTLVGLDQPAATANSGDLLPLVFYWRVTAPLTAALEASLELQSADGAITALGAFASGPAEMPAAGWMPDTAWRVPHDFILPPTVPAGPARLRVRLAGSGAQTGPVDVGALTIITPQRQFGRPPMRVRQEHQFGPGFKLLGFDRDPLTAQSGQTLVVTLYWQATVITDQTCKVFVHVVDAAGQIVAQHDSAPAGGTRPTTGWLPPEVIADEHTLALPAGLPPGQFTLRVGMYNAQTQQRVPVLDQPPAPASDFVDLEQFTVSQP